MLSHSASCKMLFLSALDMLAPPKSLDFHQTRTGHVAVAWSRVINLLVSAGTQNSFNILFNYLREKATNANTITNDGWVCVQPSLCVLIGFRWLVSRSRPQAFQNHGFRGHGQCLISTTLRMLPVTIPPLKGLTSLWRAFLFGPKMVELHIEGLRHVESLLSIEGLLKVTFLRQVWCWLWGSSPACSLHFYLYPPLYINILASGASAVPREKSESCAFMQPSHLCHRGMGDCRGGLFKVALWPICWVDTNSGNFSDRERLGIGGVQGCCKTTELSLQIESKPDLIWEVRFDISKLYIVRFSSIKLKDINSLEDIFQAFLLKKKIPRFHYIWFQSWGNKEAFGIGSSMTKATIEPMTEKVNKSIYQRQTLPIICP